MPLEPVPLHWGSSEGAELSDGLGNIGIVVDSRDAGRQDPMDATAPVSGIEAIICSYAWSCADALAVAWCESRHDPGAIDPGGENHGLWQVNNIWAAHFGPERWAQRYDAEENTAMAWEIYVRGGGWFPWSCRPGGGE